MTPTEGGRNVDKVRRKTMKLSLNKETVRDLTHPEAGVEEPTPTATIYKTCRCPTHVITPCVC